MAEEDRDDTGGVTLGEPPEPDPTILAVARAKLVHRLFADDVHVEIGRYRLIQELGAGGMGVVWGAWDPELQRHVAIKLVKPQLASARDRILEEGRALARLSHPNVLPIHDVGTRDDHVYLVMEWVHGTNLRVHCYQPRTVRELVALYRAAGEGLAAAHAAGLIHRDFKPENVIVGEDGRVRVLDFGIAVTPEVAASPAGTPRYMPGEQVRGEPLTAAADQYAFCVALREAVENRDAIGEAAPVPSWLDTITARGAAEDPAARYPSMTELLDALGRDPAVVRRRRLVAGAVAATVLGAFAIGALLWPRDRELAACTGSERGIADVWNDGARARLLAHARSLGAYGIEEGERLDHELARYAARWTDAHHDACLAHARGELTTALYERTLACLAAAHAGFEIAIDVVSRSSRERFSEAVVAERSLPPVERCAMAAPASTVPPFASAPVIDRVGAELARGHILMLARDPDAIRVTTAAAAVADAIGYPPLIARAHLERGAALAFDLRRGAESVRAYERATAAALAAKDDVTFVEAYARELFVFPRMDPRDRPTGITNTAAAVPLVERIAQRTGTAGAFARTLLYNNAGTERLAAGDPAGARVWFRRAVDEPHPGDRDVELWVIYGNLAMTTEDATERMRLFDIEREHLVQTFGPHHAFTLNARLREAAFNQDRGVAMRELREVCRALADYHPHFDALEECGYELAWMLDESGDREAARAAMAMAREGDDANAAIARLYGDLDKSTDVVAAAEALATRFAAGPTWWARLRAADAWLVAALACERLDVPRAIAAVRHAIAVLDDPAIPQRAPYIQRRVERLRSMQARLTGSR